MEITMTITGNLDQMAQILTFAQDMGLASSTIAQMRSNAQQAARQQNAQVPAMPQPSPAQIPAQPNPFAAAPQAIPQQMGVPAQQPGIPAAIPQNAPTQGNLIPQSAPTYSIQDLTLAARPLMEMGKQAELAQLLAEFGVQAVAMLPENRRADFAARLRAMGGQI